MSEKLIWKHCKMSILAYKQKTNSKMNRWANLFNKKKKNPYQSLWLPTHFCSLPRIHLSFLRISFMIFMISLYNATLSKKEKKTVISLLHPESESLPAGSVRRWPPWSWVSASISTTEDRGPCSTHDRPALRISLHPENTYTQIGGKSYTQLQISQKSMTAQISRIACCY